MSSKLPRSFYARDTRVVAKELLGKVLVHDDGGVRRAARIVETEAYHGPLDRASHARNGPTPRSAIMFGRPGVAYVYLVYGTSHCMNVVTGPKGFPSAVLLRAAEPLESCLHGTRGPGNLCRALAIRREHDDGGDLLGPDLYIEDAPAPKERILSGRRVNVDYAGPWAEKPWRYALEGNLWVSLPTLPLRQRKSVPKPAKLEGRSSSSPREAAGRSIISSPSPREAGRGSGRGAGRRITRPATRARGPRRTRARPRSPTRGS